MASPAKEWAAVRAWEQRKSSGSRLPVLIASWIYDVQPDPLHLPLAQLGALFAIGLGILSLRK
jgi:hypothetical protein